MSIERLATGANIHAVRHAMGSLSYSIQLIKNKPHRSEYLYEYALLRLAEMRWQLGGMHAMEARSKFNGAYVALRRKHGITGERISGDG